MKTKYKITAYADGTSTIIRDLTDEEFEFLSGIFNELQFKGSLYCPEFSIYRIE